MGLPYPGGPALAAAAADGRDGAFTFSRPMTDRPGLDFSFSGLKTQVLLAYREHADDPNVIADVARAFERAVADTLVTKCRRALAETGVRALVVAGGVGANRLLRQLRAAPLVTVPLGLVAGLWCVNAFVETEKFYCMTAPVFIAIAALVSATCLLAVPRAIAILAGIFPIYGIVINVGVALVVFYVAHRVRAIPILSRVLGRALRFEAYYREHATNVTRTCAVFFSAWRSCCCSRTQDYQ